MSVIAIDGVVMRYPWGRTDLISRLLGRDVPSPTPEAELWFGAHCRGASPLRGAVTITLADVIANNPTGLLGDDVAARYGNVLPFLLKVLAVNEPLSLQIHPDSACVDELDASGDPEQVLSDRLPKPEMIVAVGELVAFCGLQSSREAAATARQIGSAAWDDVAHQIDHDGVRHVCARLIRHDETTINRLYDDLAARLATGFDAPHAAALADLCARYPYDRAVVVAVVMRLVVLHDGEALFIPPGVLHCYLSGAGVEVMASSDNVFRVGLTTKRCHPELVASLVETCDREPVLVDPVRDGPATRFPAATSWFALSRIRVTPGECRLPHAPIGPSLLLTMRGDVTVRDGDVTVTLLAGTAVFVAAGVTVTCDGDADLFWAQLGSDTP